MTAAFQADRVFVGHKKRLPGRARAKGPETLFPCRNEPLPGVKKNPAFLGRGPGPGLVSITRGPGTLGEPLMAVVAKGGPAAKVINHGAGNPRGQAQRGRRAVLGGFRPPG